MTVTKVSHFSHSIKTKIADLRRLFVKKEGWCFMRQSINSKRIAIVAVVIVLLFWLIDGIDLSQTFDVRQRLKQNSPVEIN